MKIWEKCKKLVQIISLVQKGFLNKEKFYIPKDQVESYDGDTLRFRISETEINQNIWENLPRRHLQVEHKILLLINPE